MKKDIVRAETIGSRVYGYTTAGEKYLLNVKPLCEIEIYKKIFDPI